MTTLYEIVFVIVGIFTAIYLFLYFFIIMRLKSKHKSKWGLLEKPDLIINNNNKGGNIAGYNKAQRDVELNYNLLSRAIEIINRMDKIKFKYVVLIIYLLFGLIIIIKRI